MMEKGRTTKLSTKAKVIGFFLAVLLFFLPVAWATQASVGFNYGKRKLNDSFLESVYGEGYVFSPYIRVSFNRLFSLDVSYEAGYRKSAPIGLYNEDSVLSIRGLEVASVLSYRFNRVIPYLKLGLGYYAYTQDIQSEFVRFKVDHSKATYFLAGGAHIFLIKSFFFTVEVKYVPLKVTPFDRRVDLGGMRYLFGVGYEMEF